MTISDDEVIAELTESGAAIDDYFLVEHQICLENRRGELVVLVIDDVEGEEEGEMHAAIEEYLQRRGARVYASRQEFDKLHTK